MGEVRDEGKTMEDIRWREGGRRQEDSPSGERLTWKRSRMCGRW
jgi:hypothetical protein